MPRSDFARETRAATKPLVVGQIAPAESDSGTIESGRFHYVSFAAEMFQISKLAMDLEVCTRAGVRLSRLVLLRLSQLRKRSLQLSQSAFLLFDCGSLFLDLQVLF